MKQIGYVDQLVKGEMRDILESTLKIMCNEESSMSDIVLGILDKFQEYRIVE